MSLKSRLLVLVMLILICSMSVTWFGIKPAYEKALIEERVQKLSQFNQQITRDADSQVAYWLKLTDDLSYQLEGTSSAAEQSLSTFIRIFPEIHLIKITDLQTRQFLEVKQKQTPVSEILPEWKTQMLPIREFPSVNIRWIAEKEVLLINKQIQNESGVFDINILINDISLKRKLFDASISDDLTVLISSGGKVFLSNRSNKIGIVTAEPKEVIEISNYPSNNDLYYAATGLFQFLPYALSVEISESEITKPVKNLIIQSTTVIFLAFILLSIGGWYIVSVLNKPLKTLINYIKPMGQFMFNTPILSVGLPELEPVTDSLDAIRVQLLRYQRLNVEKIIVEQMRNNLLMSKASEMIAILDSDDKIQFMNDKLRNFLGEFSLTSLPDNWSDIEKIKSLKIKNIQTEKEERENIVFLNHHSEWQLDSESKNRYYFRVHKLELHKEDKKQSSLIVLVDLTKELEMDIKRNEMISFIIHELKNPIASISGFTQLLQYSQTLTKKEMSYVNYVLNSTKEMDDLISRFLTVSRLESQTAVIEKSPLFIPGILQQIEDSLQIQLQQKALNLNIKIQPGTDFVEGSEILLTDALKNLLSNAIKYGNPNRKIDIGIAKLNGFITISVTDYGFGIPKEHQGKIFDKFYRIKDYQETAGTGLGLAYVKEIMEKHGGKITLDSDSAIGTRFTLWFPDVINTMLD